MIPLPCSKMHVLARTSSGHPFLSIPSLLRLVQQPLQVIARSAVPTLRTPPFHPSYLRTLHTMQDFSSLLFSSSLAHFAFCVGCCTILSFRVQTFVRVRCLAVAATIVVLTIHGTIALCFAVISCPLFFCSFACFVLFCHTASFFFALLSPLHFSLPVTLYSWCISSSKPEARATDF